MSTYVNQHLHSEALEASGSPKSSHQADLSPMKSQELEDAHLSDLQEPLVHAAVLGLASDPMGSKGEVTKGRAPIEATVLHLELVHLDAGFSHDRN